MKTLSVTMERNGIPVPVGTLTCVDGDDIVFGYEREYLSSNDAVPISLSLPLQEEPFSPSRSGNYFEGLLPEGYMRKTVSRWLHLDENDCFSLLARLGGDCPGAVQIQEGTPPESAYEKLSADDAKSLAAGGAEEAASLMIRSRLTLPGASGKTGLCYDGDSGQWYLGPGTHIVKQSHVRLKNIVVNERLNLLTAGFLGLPVPNNFIVTFGSGGNEDLLLAVQRFDRLPEKPSPLRLHQEDFAQALGIPSGKKYEENREGYLRSMFGLLRNWSSNPVEDQLQLWKTVIYDFLTGNTDNHLKNFSLLYGGDLKGIRLSPVFDRISTAVYEGLSRNMALSIGGEISMDRINENSFRLAAKEAGLGEKMAMREFTRMADRFEKALREAAALLREEGFPEAAEIRERIMRTGGIASLLI